MAEFIRAAYITLLLRGGAALFSFGGTVLVARALGADQAGIFFLAITVVSVLSVLSRFGMDKALLRIVSVASAEGDFAAITQTVSFSLKLSFLSSFSLGALLFFLSKPATDFWRLPSSAAQLFDIFALLIPFMALQALVAEVLQGVRRHQGAVYIGAVSLNVFFFFILGAFLLSSPQVDLWVVGIIYLFSAAITLFMAAFMIRRLLFWRDFMVNDGSRKILNSCLPLYVVDIMSMAVVWGGQLLSANWLAPEEIAFLAVSQRTAGLIGMLLMAFNAVTAPHFATFYSRGDIASLRLMSQKSASLVSGVAIPVVLVMLCFPSEIMSIFGVEFKEAASLLRIMAVGQLINAMTGSVGYLLMMTGHERDMRNITFISGMLALVLPCLLLPVWGGVGAALAVALSLSFQNILALILVKKRLGFWTIVLPLGWRSAGRSK